MKIIGHRGAAGLETENTLEAIRMALDLGVDGVEFDVWTSKDGVPVVHHDENLQRMTGFNGLIPQMDYRDIKKIKNHGGKIIPTAEEALGLIGNKAVIFEIKDSHLTESVGNLLSRSNNPNLVAISFNNAAVEELKALRPDLKIYITMSREQRRAVHFALSHNLPGVALNHRYFNPLIYRQCIRNNLDVDLWTVNSEAYLGLLGLLKPKIDYITTDYPDLALRILR